VPTEFTAALGSIAKGFGGVPDAGPGPEGGPEAPRAPRPRREQVFTEPALTDPAEALAEARRQAEAATADATSSGTRSGMPFDPNLERGQRPGGGTVPPVPDAARGAEPRPLGGVPQPPSAGEAGSGAQTEEPPAQP
jgi:hypothetical protein